MTNRFRKFDSGILLLYIIDRLKKGGRRMTDEDARPMKADEGLAYDALVDAIMDAEDTFEERGDEGLLNFAHSVRESLGA